MRPPLHIRGRHLPHWFQSGRTYFVTFRMNDAIPQSKLKKWREHRDQFHHNHPKPWSAAEEAYYRKEISSRLERWADRGYGACSLRKPEIRRIVEDALRYFNEAPDSADIRYQLDAWVIMPNHVHLLVAPREGYLLNKITHSWKSFTATRINEALGRTGTFWMEESYDHMVRDAESMRRIRRYIERNPERARLEEDEYTLQM